jgi:hypothetical protein
LSEFVVTPDMVVVVRTVDVALTVFPETGGLVQVAEAG